MRGRVFEQWTPANSMIVVCALLVALIATLVNALFAPGVGAWLLVGVVAVLFVAALLWVRSLLRRGRDVRETGP